MWTGLRSRRRSDDTHRDPVDLAGGLERVLPILRVQNVYRSVRTPARTLPAHGPGVPLPTHPVTHHDLPRKESTPHPLPDDLRYGPPRGRVSESSVSWGRVPGHLREGGDGDAKPESSHSSRNVNTWTQDLPPQTPTCSPRSSADGIGTRYRGAVTVTTHWYGAPFRPRPLGYLHMSTTNDRNSTIVRRPGRTEGRG